MIVSLIAAAAENGVIGNKGMLPWHLPDDLKHFKDLTKGHAVIMGRKTFESIGRPLPDRQNIVITRNKDFRVDGAEIVSSFEESLKKAKGEEVFVIGGGEIYRESMAKADKIYLTRVFAPVDGDAFFPEIDPKVWNEVSMEEHKKDEKHAYPFAFTVLERRSTKLGSAA